MITTGDNGRISIEEWNSMVEKGTIMDFTGIKVGDKIKSFDFRWNIGCYYVGEVMNIAPAPDEVCPCSGNHLHIKVDHHMWESEKDMNGVEWVFPACVEHDMGGGMFQIVKSPTS